MNKLQTDQEEELREYWNDIFRRQGVALSNMSSELEPLRRQIEMLILLYKPKTINPYYRIDELAYRYGVDANTIKNDLKKIEKLRVSRKTQEIIKKEINYEDQKKVLLDCLLEHLLVNFIIEHYCKGRAKNIFSKMEDNRFNYSIIRNINRIIETIEFKDAVKLKYMQSNHDIIELKIVPWEIILKESELGFIGIHNSSVDIYEFKNVISIERTATSDAKTYKVLIKEFYINNLKPTLSINTNIIIKHKNILSYFYISHFINNKTNSDGTESEIINTSLEDFAKWVTDEYLPFIVIDLQEITKTENHDKCFQYFKRYNISYNIKNVFKNEKFETKQIPSSFVCNPSIISKDIIVDKIENPNTLKTQKNNNNLGLDSNSIQCSKLRKLDPYKNKPYISEKIEVNLSLLKIHESFDPTLTSLWERILYWYK